MIGDFFNSMYDYVSKQNARNSQRAKVLNEYDSQKETYKNSLSEAQSVFNRDYYSSYIDGTATRKMLNRLHDRLREHTRALYNTSAVMGGNVGAVGAVHRMNNTALSNLESTLGEADNNRRKQAERDYENSRNSLMNYISEAKRRRNQGLLSLHDESDDVLSLLYRPISRTVGGYYDNALAGWVNGNN